MRKGEPWLTAKAAATVSRGTPHHSADRCRGQRIGDLMRSVYGQLDISLSPRRRQAELCTQVPVEENVLGPHVRVRINRIPQHGTCAEQGHGADPGVIEVQDRET